MERRFLGRITLVVVVVVAAAVEVTATLVISYSGKACNTTFVDFLPTYFWEMFYTFFLIYLQERCSTEYEQKCRTEFVEECQGGYAGGGEQGGQVRISISRTIKNKNNS